MKLNLLISVTIMTLILSPVLGGRIQKESRSGLSLTSSSEAPSCAWKSLPQGANDIAVSPVDDTVWIITNTPTSDGGGYTIAYKNASTEQFTTIPGSAVRISVDSQGYPWVVNALNAIWRYTANGWVLLPGAAEDIGCGADGSVWIIGKSVFGGGNYQIYKYNPAVASNWDLFSGGAVRVSVDPQGYPWVVNAQDAIWRYNSTGWHLLSGAAKDIGVGSEGSVWVIGTNPLPGGYGIYEYNINGNSWNQIGGAAVAIAVDNEGLPWVVNDLHVIYQWFCPKEAEQVVEQEAAEQEAAEKEATEQEATEQEAEKPDNVECSTETIVTTVTSIVGGPHDGDVISRHSTVLKDHVRKMRKQTQEALV